MRELSLYGLSTRTPVRLLGRADELDAAVRSAWSRCLDLDAAGAGELQTEGLTVRLLEEGDASVPGPDADGDSIADTDPGPLLQLLTQRVTYAKIHAQAGRLLMLHAAAVAHPETGRAIAFVAPGGTGKTTLARHLGARYGYLTDETVAIDAGGLIHPYPKPLSIRGESGYAKTETSPDELGLRTPPSACRLRRIVLLDRSDDHAGTPVVAPLTPFQAIAALAPETSSLASLPRPLHGLADLLGTLDETVRLTYRDADADSVADLVADWLVPA